MFTVSRFRLMSVTILLYILHTKVRLLANLEHQFSDCPKMKTLEESRQFKGVRMRKWGKWVSEERIPNSRAKIWLGSYDTSEQAARAFDAAIYCLRGPNATKFNFPDSVPVIPAASSLSRRQIQIAAAKYARDQIPSTTINIDNNIFTEDAEILPKSPPLPETGALIDTKQDSE